MAMDHYAPCPCGSGKKLKFCKCVDNVQDLEKVTRLMEGGQEVAALDRINQLLKKTPNAAWLLALKAELALAMGDEQLFSETANRFHKLKPDNPLALIMRSLASLAADGGVEQACPLLLEGLAESRDSIPGMAVFAIRTLLNRLIVERRRFMGGFWEDFLADIAPSSEQQELASPLNLVLRTIGRDINDVPPGAPWKERMNEVLVLLRSLRIEQAEKKLQSILRDFPDEVVPLQRLLEAQYARLDQHAAAATARKLSTLAAIGLEQRALYYAISLELDRDRSRLAVPAVVHYAELELTQEKTERLHSFNFLYETEGLLDSFLQELLQEETHPQRTFLLFDGAEKAPEDAAQDSDNAASENAPGIGRTQVGFMAIFGKETDRPARAIIFGFDYPATAAKIQEIENLLELGNPIQSTIREQLNERGLLHYDQFLTRGRFAADNKLPLPQELRSPVLADEFLAIRFKDLDGQTLLEASRDDQKQLQVVGLLSHFEGCHSLIMADADIQSMYERLGVARPVNQLPKGNKIQKIWDIAHTRVADAELPVLTTLFFTARMFKLDRLMYQAGNRMLTMEGLDSRAKLNAVLSLLSLEPNLDRRIELTHLGEPLFVELGGPVGELVAARFRFLIEAGDDASAIKTLTDGLQKYPEDPTIIAFAQMLMQQAQGGPPGGAARFAAEAPAATASGLLLPGDPSAAPAGESKLWLPGS